ncbi:MAG: DUF177 domain-containing protein [bacterium]
MKIDVSDLLKSFGAEIKIDRSETLSFPPARSDARRVSGADKEDALNLTSPVNVKLKLTNTGNAILVSGTLKTEVKLSCCRCLKDFNYPVNIKIEEEYGKQAQVLPGSKSEEIELKEKDFIFEIGKDNIIDLDEAIRQNIIVALPIKPLCNKACKLPEVAGSSIKKIDPRLAKLKTIRLSGGK